ncbi:MAG TPA: class I SAM-dependent methyltransferase, partial [Chryseosolibacter sp.]|nr:class I SAM-dependent methyltransferase [Chryseosolibacter sp.]
AGLFTRAIATLLTPPSIIYAVDKHRGALEQLPVTICGNLIEKLALDFTHTDRLPSGLDGILMANALHFVPEKHRFLEAIVGHLRPVGKIIVIEYDTDKGNPWVPHPISFNTLKALLSDLGLESIETLYRQPSLLTNYMLYSAVATVTA